MHEVFNTESEPAFALTPRAQAAVDFFKGIGQSCTILGPDDIEAGTVSIPNRGLTQLPDLSAVRVTGDFICNDNLLTTLKGAPQSVGGDFICANNRLRDLKGAPQAVYLFDCSGNDLESLEGAPRRTRKFFCKDNKLTSLKGGPEVIEWHLDCSNNQLTSLEGAPRYVRGVTCANNRLTSVKGVETGLIGWMDARGNPLEPVAAKTRTPELAMCFDKAALPKAARKPKMRIAWPAAYWRQSPGR